MLMLGKSLPETIVDIFKAQSYDSTTRKGVYYAQRILVVCTSRHLFQHGQLCIGICKKI